MKTTDTARLADAYMKHVLADQRKLGYGAPANPGVHDAAREHTRAALDRLAAAATPARR